jgi:hypothetical protein
MTKKEEGIVSLSRVRLRASSITLVLFWGGGAMTSMTPMTPKTPMLYPKNKKNVKHLAR